MFDKSPHPIPPSTPSSTNPSGGSDNLRAYFTTSSGRRIWARDYGYDGWPIGRNS